MARDTKLTAAYRRRNGAKALFMHVMLLLALGLPPGSSAADPALRQAVVEAFAEDVKAQHAMSYDFTGLLQARRFDELDQQLISLQQHSEQGANEWAVLQAYEQFYTADESLGPYLDEWVAHNKGLWTGRLARGIYHVAVGWDERGKKYFRETPRENIQGMQRHFAIAKPDLRAAVKAKPKVLIGYKMLLIIANTLGDDLEEHRLMHEALKIAPDTYYVRWQYIYGQEPKWGGSLRIIERFAEQSQKVRDRNPRVYALLGYQYGARADALKSDKEYEQAVKLYTRAIDYAPVGRWLRSRAWNLKKLQRYDESLRDLDDLLRITPEDTALLKNRGNLYIKMRNYPAAIADYEHALVSAPDDSNATNSLGWIHNKQGKREEAAGYFDRTLAHDPDNVYALKYCGIVNQRLGQRNKAEGCLSHAVEVAPQNADAWRYYGEFLHTGGDPRHVEALRNYLKYADRDREKAMYDKIKEYVASKE